MFLDRENSVEGRQFVSWSLKPSQPQRNTSGLNTNFNLFLSYSFNKSLYHQSFFPQTKAQILSTMSDTQKDNKRERERQTVSWCFEPSRPQRITSGLQTDTERKSPRVSLTVSHPGVFFRIISDDRWSCPHEHKQLTSDILKAKYI